MMTSNRPYFIRSVYEWIVDNDLTPYLLVNSNDPDSDLPQDFAQDGRIILNISPSACRQLQMDNDMITFSTRFSGKTVDISVSPTAVFAIYAKENGRGMEFGLEYDDAVLPPTKRSSFKAKKTAKPSLTLVKSSHEQHMDPLV